MIADDLRSKYADVKFDTDSSNGKETLKNYVHELMDDNDIFGRFTFYMTPTGIVFVFAPETLASFEAGTLITEYPYDSGALTGNYKSSYSGPGNFKGKFVGIIPDTEVLFVENQDKVHTLSIYEKPKEGTDADDPSDFYVTVTFDGKKSTSTIHSFGTEYYLAETKNGKYYLLADTSEENDWETIYIFDLNGKKIKNPKASAYGLYGSIPLDINGFAAGTRSEVLSTYTDKGYFSLTNGTLRSKSKWFAAAKEVSIVITLKKEMKCRVAGKAAVSPDKLSFKNKRLAAGTRLKILRTDNKRTADLITTKGDKIVRLTIDSTNDYPQTIGGKSVEDLFKGVVFAG
jgi:hypothetical protein